jgi:hypothetical protein
VGNGEWGMGNECLYFSPCLTGVGNCLTADCPPLRFAQTLAAFANRFAEPGGGNLNGRQSSDGPWTHRWTCSPT